jgi:flagellar biosynthesis protein FlhF
MQPIPFTAASAEEAVAQIRAKLGPEAVVLNVRPLPANGLARLWQKPMIEVLAYRPETPVVETTPVVEALAEFRQQLHDIKQQVENHSSKTESEPANYTPQFSPPAFAAEADLDCRDWRIGAVLQRAGLLPLHAQSVLDQIRTDHGDIPPSSLAGEISLAREALSKFWRHPRPISAKSRHILIGPAGSGKTTYLCKWLTQAVLMEARSARVWRLDGTTANMAESLSVYCDILGVPSERIWQNSAESPSEDLGFIDLPGVDWRNPMAIKELAGQLRQFGSPQIHLVLNGAYDISILLAQIRAFASLPIQDLVFAHLDEEPRWGKLWNLILGTNYAIRHLSTGQNIPGDFCEASPEIVFSRQFSHK